MSKGVMVLSVSVSSHYAGGICVLELRMQSEVDGEKQPHNKSRRQ